MSSMPGGGLLLLIAGLPFYVNRDLCVYVHDAVDYHPLYGAALETGTARIGWPIVGALALYFCPLAWVQTASFYRTAAALDNASHRLHDALAADGGSVAFLTPDNTYRPPSVDSSICKGGTDIFQSTWGVSPFIKSMFPDRWCFLYGGTADVTPFANVVFIKLDEEPFRAALKRVEDHFSTSLANFDCAKFQRGAR